MKEDLSDRRIQQGEGRVIPSSITQENLFSFDIPFIRTLSVNIQKSQEIFEKYKYHFFSPAKLFEVKLPCCAVKQTIVFYSRDYSPSQL